jgi:CRISPR-associated protein NE0113 (Cas_NE0113)
MSPDNAAQHVLIATLGTKPQVVTTALDLLMRGGHPIDEVIVLLTACARVWADCRAPLSPS